LLLKIKWHLSSQQPKKAVEYLNRAFQLNQKVFYAPFDMQLRFLEVLSFVFMHDYEYALHLAYRNKKYLHTKNRKIFSFYFDFFSTIIRVLSDISEPGFINQEDLNHIYSYSSENTYLYADLLESLANHLSVYLKKS
jgi:hypothetical protein